MTESILPDETVRETPLLIRWLTWPALLIAAISHILYAADQGIDLSLAAGISTLVTVSTLVTLEFIFPLKQIWKMTWASFFRDLKYFVAGGATIAGTNALFAWVGISLANGHNGPITDWPLWLAVPAGILVVDFLEYWQHRLSHEMKGPVGGFLWRSHAAHHLPDKIYVLMHPAGHPINGFIVRGLATILPLYFLGANAETVALVNLIIGVQGVVSHTNLDLRAGWFNYIFVGAELHRMHHSADMSEAKNYAVALSFLDIIFGTFVYKPKQYPERIGVLNPEAYPQSTEILKVMALPFHPKIK